MVMARPRCLACGTNGYPLSHPRREWGYGPCRSSRAIVFCHGIWADGSCFSKVIPPLQAEGYEVIAPQYNLDSAQTDIDA